MFDLLYKFLIMSQNIKVILCVHIKHDALQAGVLSYEREEENMAVTTNILVKMSGRLLLNPTTS